MSKKANIQQLKKITEITSKYQTFKALLFASLMQIDGRMKIGRKQMSWSKNAHLF